MYWGRGMHLALTVVDMEVRRGSTEAVEHEAVFATTFTVPSMTTGSGAASEPGSSSDPSRYKQKWCDFASGVLLALPTLVGQSAFKTEYLRCSSNLVNGIEDDAKPEELERVG